MTKFHESEYAKRHRPYFCTAVDTVLVLVPLKTPTGRWSKYYGTLKMGQDRKDKKERLERFLNDYMHEVFAKELERGYTITEPLLYNGEWYE